MPADIPPSSPDLPPLPSLPPSSAATSEPSSELLGTDPDDSARGGSDISGERQFTRFTSGQFAGQTLRIEISEIQQASAGRKSYPKDRRPLDPPPACVLKIFVVEEPGTAAVQEHEVDYDDMLPEGWLCHVELFRAISVSSRPKIAPLGNVTDSTINSNLTTPVPIVLGENVTAELVGTTVAQALKPKMDGRRIAIFTFMDIASKIEGRMVLRYRVFNVLATTEGNDHRPILAECTGGSFKVYNSKAFPGLAPTTPLTKALEEIGVFSGKRETVRKRSQDKLEASEREEQ